MSVDELKKRALMRRVFIDQINMMILLTI